MFYYKDLPVFFKVLKSAASVRFEPLWCPKKTEHVTWWMTVAFQARDKARPAVFEAWQPLDHGPVAHSLRGTSLHFERPGRRRDLN